ncbi:MAG: TetR/AcrR family transcriptional regulator [Planctomycetes bacterium]|nr:TetR/AcrR family transcriptional regulator [Planctomycetota bacterium]
MAKIVDITGKRHLILLAAEKVFDACGYASATMEAVAAEAGIAKGSLYTYFRSKKDLFTQVFVEVLSEDEALVRDVFRRPIGAGEKLQEFLAHWFMRVARYKPIGRLMLEFWVHASREEDYDELRRMLGEAYAAWRAMLAKIVQEGVNSGEFRADVEVEAAVSLILAVMDGIGVQSIIDVGVNVDEQLLAGLEKVMFLSLTGSESPDATEPTKETRNG